MILFLPGSPCPQSRSQRSQWGGSTSARPRQITWGRRANRTLTRGERHAITCKWFTMIKSELQYSHPLLMFLSSQIFHAGGGAACSVPQSELHCGCSSVWEDHRQGNVWPCLSASYNNHIPCECDTFLSVYCTYLSELHNHVDLIFSIICLSILFICMAVIPCTLCTLQNTQFRSNYETKHIVVVLWKSCIFKMSTFRELKKNSFFQLYGNAFFQIIQWVFWMFYLS